MKCRKCFIGVMKVCYNLIFWQTIIFNCISKTKYKKWQFQKWVHPSQIFTILCVNHNFLWLRPVCQALILIYLWQTSFLFMCRSSKAILLVWYKLICCFWSTFLFTTPKWYKLGLNEMNCRARNDIWPCFSQECSFHLGSMFWGHY